MSSGQSAVGPGVVDCSVMSWRTQVSPSFGSAILVLKLEAESGSMALRSRGLSSHEPPRFEEMSPSVSLTCNWLAPWPEPLSNPVTEEGNGKWNLWASDSLVWKCSPPFLGRWPREGGPVKEIGAGKGRGEMVQFCAFTLGSPLCLLFAAAENHNNEGRPQPLSFASAGNWGSELVVVLGGIF